MNNVLMGVWQNAPIWVWPLFFVLLAIGFFSMKPRKSSIVPYFFYPLFGITAAKALMNLNHVPENWIAFASFYVIGVFVGFHWQDALITEKRGSMISLQGEKITILLLMVIFFSNFVNGVFEDVNPKAADTLFYTFCFAGVIGLCSGSFTGRALRVVTLGHRVATPSI